MARYGQCDSDAAEDKDAPGVEKTDRQRYGAGHLMMMMLYVNDNYDDDDYDYDDDDDDDDDHNNGDIDSDDELYVEHVNS
ncbi:hypothetical protein ElyMa_002766300 [Elysia marginata]|uniref:Uncharacterized protein n=1 Tax=Elysia marginata TaxID=1093978 RepID=A0AAV4HM89_9GAST|nr:hypothetical protein ElyMa_002766300 [Elysia marginata]